MTTDTRGDRGRDPSGDAALVDPRAPRFGQAITTIGLASAIALDAPSVLFGVAGVLALAVLSNWRVDLYGVAWRATRRALLDPPATRESPAPHRFATVAGAAGTSLASALVLAGLPGAGYALAAIVACAAGLAATTGVCLGCRLYRQVAFFRRLGVV